MEIQASDFDEVARMALEEHTKHRGLDVSMSEDHIFSFGVGDLACRVNFIKGSDHTGQVEFTVWIDAGRKHAYVDQCTWFGDNILECIAGAVHNWCAGQLPVWLAVFQGKDVEGLLTDMQISWLDAATMQPYNWQVFVGIGQSVGTCRSVLERVKETPPYKLVITELVQLQMQGYFKERPGMHCIKLFYGRGMDGESMEESRIDGEHWDGANDAMHAHQWATEKEGFFFVKQFLVMMPPNPAQGDVTPPMLAVQAVNTMVPDRPASVEIKGARAISPTTAGTKTTQPTKISPLTTIVIIVLVVAGGIGLVLTGLAAFLIHKP